jgi:glutamate-ammonia-ligase adenylyltransferase
LIPTLAGFCQYLEKNARLWEKQALLKLRPIAGDLPLGEEFREMSYPFIVNLPPQQVKTEVFTMKQRTEEILRERDVIGERSNSVSDPFVILNLCCNIFNW